MNKLKIAVQKSGRLSSKSLELFRECGIILPDFKNKLKAAARNFPLEILFLRDDDIPRYVEQNIVHLGIIGENELAEQQCAVNVLRTLGFAQCRLSLAVPRDTVYPGTSFFAGKTIATSYPVLVNRFLKENQLDATVVEISGSVEVAPGIGLADAIADLVSSGSTLLHNGLKEVETILESQAVLIANNQLSAEIQELSEQLQFRLQAVQNSREHKYILLNAPNTSILEITALLPGMKAPTILPLAEPGWSSIHSVVRETEFWRVISRLKQLGAEGILIVPIEKMVI